MSGKKRGRPTGPTTARDPTPTRSSTRKRRNTMPAGAVSDILACVSGEKLEMQRRACERKRRSQSADARPAAAQPHRRAHSLSSKKGHSKDAKRAQQHEQQQKASAEQARELLQSLVDATKQV